MRVTVDASVFVAAARRAEANHEVSDAFLSTIHDQRVGVFCPTLVLVETIAALARVMGNIELLPETRARLEALPELVLVPLDRDLAERAAGLASTQRMRGADAVYLAVAQVSETALVTWDVEMLQRGAAVRQTMTPADWLQSRRSAQEEV